jgi:hypothetical protein
LEALRDDETIHLVNRRTPGYGDRFAKTVEASQLFELLGHAMEKRYVKGSKVDRQKVANATDLRGPSDPEVDDYVRIIIDGLNRSGYRFIGAGYEHIPPGQQPDGHTHLAVIIILDEGKSSGNENWEL